MAGFNPDQYLKEKVGEATAFDPDAYLRQKFGDTPTGVSAVRQFVQGATGNFSDELAGLVEGAGRAAGLSGLGGPMKDIGLAEGGPTLDVQALKEAYQKGRDKERLALKRDVIENPTTSAVSNIAGAVASPLNKLAKGLSLAKGGAVLGGIQGLGGSEADSALGAAGDTALGAGLGAVLGKATEKAGDFVGRLPSKFRATQSAELNAEQSAAANAQSNAKSGASIAGGGVDAEQSGQLFKIKAPQSLDELSKWKPQLNTGEVLGKRRLQEIESLVPDLNAKPLKYHYGMMENPKAMKELKLQFENLPTDSAKKIATYNQEMVNESARKIQDTVSAVAGGETKGLSDAGLDLIDSVKQKYSSEKDALGPVFEKLQKRSKGLDQTAAKDLIVALGENTKLGKLLEENPQTGRMTLAKNTPRTGLSDAEHGMLSRLVDDLNDGMSFKEVQSAREFLRKATDPANPAATSEINKVRSVMLGQLEHMAGRLGDDVGQTFKAYAVNERSREALEKIIGGKVESLNAMYAANPEKVVKRVFANPNHAKLVGEYVGPEKMGQLVGSYLQNGIEKATDSATGFSPEKFKSWLKANSAFVNENLDPKAAERLKALADYGYFGKRFLDEVNPSGTAASLKAMLEPGTFVQKVKQHGITGAVVSEVGTRANAALNQRSAIRSVNEMLGTPAQARMSLNIPKESVSAAARSPIIGSTTRSLGAIQAADNDKKGKDKWANDGLQKLESHGLDIGDVQAAIGNPKIKDLLVKASDLNPGSKAMERIASQIKNMVGEQ